jgi:heparan-alpha-glucosaminide N-acetyltransferase
MDAAPGVRAAPPEPTMSAATTQAIAQPEQVAIPRDQTTVTAPPQRNVAVDAYRGLVMVLMMGEVMRWAEMARAFPNSTFWSILGYNQSHVEWAGMSLHDTIQPGFTFLAGVSLPYSIRSRQRKGESFGHMLFHTMWRSVVLIALGVFLRSTDRPITYYTFEDTLTQIGLGYTFAFLITFLKPRWQWIWLGVVLFGYWLAWALYPAPGTNFDWASVGVSPDFVQRYLYHGFAAHWNKNSNLGQAFDVWFLNLFPRTSRFAYNDGGYLTLSFIPTLGTMVLGLIAGRWFHENAPKIPLRKFAIAAVGLMAAGLLLHFTGICPVVKRIWTPAWTLWSGGVCFAFLAAFSWVIDVRGYRKIAFPLVVVGMNSIAAYLIAHLWEEFILQSFRIHLGMRFLNMFGTALEPFFLGVLTMLTYWVILYWMYKKRLFIRI